MWVRFEESFWLEPHEKGTNWDQSFLCFVTDREKKTGFVLMLMWWEKNGSETNYTFIV